MTFYDKDAPWITPAVKSAVKRNKRVYKKWVQRGRISEEKAHVNYVQKETNNIIKLAKKAYIDDLSKKNCDPHSGVKVFWSAYKRLLNNKKNTNIPPIVDGETLITNFQEKANIFNEYFAK